MAVRPTIASLRMKLFDLPATRRGRVSNAIGLANLIVALAYACAFAQSVGTGVSEDTLANEVNDPVAALTQFQLKNEYTPAEYGTNAQPNTIQIRSVFAVRPHLFTPLEQLVRPTLQIVTVPRGKGSATTTAIDDFQLLDLFVMPLPDAKETGFRWGVGTYWVFPTSTSNFTGNGAWQLGPSWGFSWQVEKLKLAALFQQSTSFAYTSSHSKSVAQLQIQPILNYDLMNGWYVTSSNANWKIDLKHKSSTEIPISVGLGKIWKMSNGYSANAAIQGECMAYRQFAIHTEQFTLVFQLSLLLPQVNL
jgi:hypothetical protein